MIHLAVQAEVFPLLHGFGASVQMVPLAVFMGGFAVGAVALGLAADRIQRPLLVFGALQIVAGGFGLAAPSVAAALGSAPSLALHAIATLALPAFACGAATVLLVRSSSHTTDRGALSLGVVVGALLWGGTVGFPLTASLGAVVGFGIALALGVAGIALSFATGPREFFASDADVPASLTGDAEVSVLLALLVTGAVIPLQRFAWGRLLPFALSGDDAHAFGLLLHLSGIGLGAFLSTFLLSGVQNARRWLARVLFAAAVLTMAPLLYSGGLLAGGGRGPALLLVWPGAIGVGMVLPMIARVALSDREAVGRQSGALLALLGFGWCASLAFVVPSMLDGQGTGSMLVFCAVGLLATGTWIGFGRGLREWIPAGVSAVLVVLALLGGSTERAEASTLLGDGTSASVERVLEARQSGLLVFAAVESVQDGTVRVYRNRRTGAPAGEYTTGYRLLGHLPVLLHPGAKTALVADFGTGTVAGALRQHASLESITCLAEDDAVFALAPHFAAQSRDVLAQKGVTRAVAPQRRYLQGRDKEFDLVVLEGEAADSARGGLFYTKEYYAAVQPALRDKGYFAQRLPIESVAPETLRRMVAAANEAFAFVTVWDFVDGLYLVAGGSEPQLTAQSLILAFSKVGRDLQDARIGAASHLLAACAADGATFAGDAAPWTDADAATPGEPDPVGARSLLPGAGAAMAFAWTDALDDAAAPTRARHAKLRALAAGGDAHVDELAALAGEDRGDLRARTAAQEALYVRHMSRKEFAQAARLSFVRDRSDALRGLAATVDGDRQRYYRILLLREGRMLSPDELDALAAQLEGAERLYVENRARVLRGENPAAGDEKLPDVTLRDPSASLMAWDELALRDDVLDAECAQLDQELDKVIRGWWEKSDDQLRATLLLYNVGWRGTLRVARKLAGTGDRDQLRGIAVVFAAAYPEDRTWERLCAHRHESVRMAAAESARVHGTRAHVDQLLSLLSDKEETVRTGAYQSLIEILGEDVKSTGYRPDNPTPEAIEKLKQLS
ncbi:MAG: spermidine synthase [Planctomycetota bacterium]